MASFLHSELPLQPEITCHSTVMINPPYCAINKNAVFFRLLNFSRLTKNENIPLSEKDKVVIIEALHSLLHNNSCPCSIFPHLYRNSVKSGLQDRLNPKLQTLLRDSTFRLIAAEISNIQWSKRNLAQFEKEKIQVILLKGAAFSGSLYPENTPRLGVDIDFLVTRESFEPACDLMSQTMVPVLLSDKRLATHETLFERVFSPKKGKTPTVEIHWGLTNPFIFRIEEKNLWAESSQHPAYHSEFIRILSPEDTLLHLAVHAFRDLDFCTHNLLDAHEVWCQWTPDPEVLLERASQWGAKRVLFYLLANCRATMETPIPDEILNRLSPSHFTNRLNKKLLQLADGQKHKHSLSFRLIQIISQLTFPDSVVNGLRFQFSYLRTRIKDWLGAHGVEHKASS